MCKMIHRVWAALQNFSSLWVLNWPLTKRCVWPLPPASHMMGLGSLFGSISVFIFGLRTKWPFGSMIGQAEHPLSTPHPPHHHQPLCRLMFHSQGVEYLQTLLRSVDGWCPAPGLCIRRSQADTQTATKLGKTFLLLESFRGTEKKETVTEGTSKTWHMTWW